MEAQAQTVVVVVSTPARRVDVLHTYCGDIEIAKVQTATCIRCGEPIFNLHEGMAEAAKDHIECRKCFYRNAPPAVYARSLSR